MEREGGAGEALRALASAGWTRYALGGLVVGASVVMWRRHRRARRRRRLLAACTVELTEEERSQVAAMFHALAALSVASAGGRGSLLYLSRADFARFVASLPASSASDTRERNAAFGVLNDAGNGDGRLSLPDFVLYFKAVKNLTGDAMCSSVLQTFMHRIADAERERAEAGGPDAAGDASDVSGADATDTRAAAAAAGAGGAGGPAGGVAAGAAVVATRTMTPAVLRSRASNQWEKALVGEVLAPHQLGVTFDDVRAAALPSHCCCSACSLRGSRPLPRRVPVRR